MEFWHKRQAVRTICDRGATGEGVEKALLKINEDTVPGFIERQDVARTMLLNCMDHKEAVKAGTASPSDYLPDIPLSPDTLPIVIRELEKDGWLVFKTEPPMWMFLESSTVTVVGPRANRM